MKRHAGSSDGAARALALGADINHVEFRLLILLSEMTNGECFACGVTKFFQKGRIGPEDLFEAIQRLSSPPISEPVRLSDEMVVWGPFDA